MFVQCGGDSFQAIKFVDMVEFSSNRSFPLLLDTLLHQPFKRVVGYVDGEIQKSRAQLCNDGGETILSDGEFSGTTLQKDFKNTKKDNSSELWNQVKYNDSSADKHYFSNKKRMKTEDIHIDQLGASYFKKNNNFVSSIRRGNRVKVRLSSEHLLSCFTEKDYSGTEITCLNLEAEGHTKLMKKWRHDTGKCVDASPLLCVLS